MPLSAPVKALALVVFLAAIAGATYAVQTSLGNTIEGQLLTVSAPRDSLNATGGHNVTYLVTVANRDSQSRDVVLEATGAATGTSIPTTVRGGSNAAIFLTVAIPDDIEPGEHDIGLRVTSEGKLMREREDLLHLTILPDAPGFTYNDSAQATYTGRLSATGRVFNTNDRDLVGLSIPKTETYRFTDSTLVVAARPRQTVVTGLLEGMVGMQPGESRTISFPPEKGYGPATEEERFDRDTVLSRQLVLENPVQEVPREAFDQYVAESRQGNGTWAPGDIFLLEQNADLWPYKIVEIDDTVVRYQLGASIGDAFTIYPFWVNGSVIEAANDTHVTFRTTPTTTEGQTFTFRQIWPGMSAVHEVNETSIVVRHSPPLGFNYASPNPAGGQPRQASIKSLDETAIIVAYPSQNPLAGRDLTFDVFVIALEKR